MNTLTHLNIFSSKIDINCLSLIECELNQFFNKRSEAALVYSSVVSQNLKIHSKNSFENMVLGYNELIFLTRDIIYKLNDYLDFDFNICEKDIKHEIDENYINLKALNKSVIQNKTTNNITLCCEKVINKSVTKSFNVLHSGLLPNYLFSKINFAALILGDNNSKNLNRKYNKELNNEIIGLLINIKIDIRNLILKNLIEQLKNHSYSDMTA